MKFNVAVILSVCLTVTTAAPIAQPEAQAIAQAEANPAFRWFNVSRRFGIFARDESLAEKDLLTKRDADASFRWYDVSRRFGIFARDEQSSSNSLEEKEEPIGYGIAISDDNSTQPIIIPLYEGEENITEEEANNYLAALGVQDDSGLTKRDADPGFRWFNVSRRFGIFARDENSSKDDTEEEEPIGYGIAISGDNSTQPIIIPLYEGEENITEEEANNYLAALGVQDDSGLTKRDADPGFRWFNVSRRFGIFARDENSAGEDNLLAKRDADASFRWFNVSRRFGIFARDENSAGEDNLLAKRDADASFRWFNVSRRFGIFA